VLPRRTFANIKDNATYLIIGGLGGIGRSLARWLVDHGAKNLILLSRNAVSSPHARELQSSLTVLGVNVALRNCDTADLTSLQTVLEDCGKTMPPVRGVIHGGMVLNDSILVHMTAAQWEAALAPKVAGTRNIDTLFSAPDSLDFLVILSSVVGMTGNASQGNYGAGGAFQDAIARNRAARGLPCVTIDLGMVNSVGFVADADQELSKRLLATGQFRPLEESDLHQLIDYAVRVPIRSPKTAQIVTGLASKALVKQNSAWTRELRFAALGEDHDVGLQGGAARQMNGDGSHKMSLKQQLAGATNVEDASKFVELAVVGKLAEMFGRPEDDIDASQPLSRYGVDSLVAVELRNWLVPNTQCDMSIFDLLGAKSLRDLANTVAARTQAK
jgi:NAD(P)-dependent dehydrogenase (short-subunit alcohol dehydrogenase family)